MCDKKSYPSQGNAERAAKRLGRKYGGDAARAYKCELCPCWHLTTQEREQHLKRIPKPYKRERFRW